MKTVQRAIFAMFIFKFKQCLCLHQSKLYISPLYNFKMIKKFREAEQPTLDSTLEKQNPTVVFLTGHNEVGQARSALWNISD